MSSRRSFELSSAPVINPSLAAITIKKSGHLRGVFSLSEGPRTLNPSLDRTVEGEEVASPIIQFDYDSPITMASPQPTRPIYLI